MKKFTCILIAAILIIQSFAITVLGDAYESSNLVPNGDFSDGISGWTLRAPNEMAEFNIAETGGSDGSPCMYVTKSQGAGDLIPSFSFEGGKAGDTYYLSAKVKLAEKGATAISKWAHLVNWTGTLIDTTGVSVSGDKWTTVKVRYTLTEDDGSTQAGYSGIPYLRISHGGSGYNGGYYIDDFSVIKNSEHNLIINPGFDEGLEDWDIRNPQYGATATWKANGGVNNTPCAYVDKAWYHGDLRQYVFGLKDAKAGQEVFVSADIKLETGSAKSCCLLIYYATKTQSNVGQYMVADQNVFSDKWTTISGTFTLPEDIVGMPEISIRAAQSECKDIGYYLDNVVLKLKDKEDYQHYFSYNGSFKSKGVFDINLRAYNYTDKERKNDYIFAAFYNEDNNLVMCECKQFSIPKYSFSDVDFPINITEEYPYSYMKVLIWSDGFIPYSETIINNESHYESFDNSVAEKLSKMIAVKSGENKILSRNNIVDLEDGAAPFTVDNTIMVPIEEIADASAMMFEWNNDTNSGVVYDAYYELNFKENSNAATVLDFTTRGKQNATLSQPVKKVNGKVFIPFVSFASIFKKNYLESGDFAFLSDEKIDITPSDEFFEDVGTVHLYVSKGGNDLNTGSIKNPVETIERAIVQARNYREKNVVIHIEEGEYDLTKPLEFDMNDSKFGVAKTTLKGEGEVILNGGTKATNWEKCNDINGVYRHKLNNPKGYTYIYEDGVMAVQARYPNRDENDVSNSYLTTDQEEYDKTEQNATAPKDSFLYKSADKIPVLQKPQNASVWIWPGGEDGYWRWHFQNLGVKSIDTSSRKITLDSQAIYTLGAGSAYYIANDKALLDAPGEFYIDDGYLYYYPRNVRNLENNISIPEAGGIISITGKKYKPVSGIEFENLTIRNSDKQDLIYMQNTRNITIKNCRLYSSGDDAIEMNGYSQNNIIKGCEIFDTANRGIYGGNASDLGMYNRVENCYIHDVGLIEKDGHGIHFEELRNNTIKNNTLHTGPRFLITLTGSGTEDVIKDGDINKIPSRNNLIAYNDISAGMQESQDGCSLYIFCSYRNILASNRIHNQEFVDTTKSEHMVGNGMYGDDLTYYTINRNNLVDNNQVEHSSDDVANGALFYMIHQKGAGSLVENNYFVKANVMYAVYASDSVSADGRKHGNYFYNNIAYTGNTTAPYERLYANDDQFTLKGADNNLFYNPSGDYSLGTVGVKSIKTLELLKLFKSLDKNTLTQNPKFVDWENNDFRLRYDSPAYALGTKDLNTRDVGVKADFKFGKSDEELKWLYVRFEGDTVDKSFRKMNLGQRVQLNVMARTESGFVADMTNVEISYTSSDRSVASVTGTGKISANKKGTATVNVTVKKDGKTLALPVTVIVE